MASTRLLTSSAASAGKRDRSPSASRMTSSMRASRWLSAPFKPSWIAAIHLLTAADCPGCKNPTFRFRVGCARTASGHAAAPPSSVMKSRRFIQSPRRRAQAASVACPLRRAAAVAGSVASGAAASLALAAAWGNPFNSLDHLVGAGKHARRNVEAERLGCLQVNDEFVLGRRLYRQVSWLLTLEDAIDVAGGAPVWVDRTR